MEKVNIPTSGRIVHYYPNGVDFIAAKGNLEFTPALVISSTGESSRISLQAFTLNVDAPIVIRIDVPYLSEGKTENLAYWDWPKY